MCAGGYLVQQDYVLLQHRYPVCLCIHTYICHTALLTVCLGQVRMFTLILVPAGLPESVIKLSFDNLLTFRLLKLESV